MVSLTSYMFSLQYSLQGPHLLRLFLTYSINVYKVFSVNLVQSNFVRVPDLETFQTQPFSWVEGLEVRCANLSHTCNWRGSLELGMHRLLGLSPGSDSKEGGG